MEKVYIDTEFIALNKFLKYVGIISTGGEAKFFLLENEIYLNGLAVTQLRKKLYINDQLVINGQEYQILRK